LVKSGPVVGEKTPSSMSASERPTLKTIAYFTGLGITTVSRALKDAPDIGSETKARVRLVARQLGYRPNRAGVRLRTGKTNVIALVLGVDAEIMSMAGQMVYGISEALQDTQYHLVLTPHMNNTDPMAPLRYIFETGSADGVIISRTEPNDERVRFLEEHDVPFVTHGRTDMNIIHPYHDYNNEAFTHEAVHRLTALGRKRLAIVSPPAHLTYCQHSKAGFYRGLKDFGATEVPFAAATTDDPPHKIKDCIEALMRGADAPDGIVCCSGNSAIATGAGVEAAGKRLGVELDMASKDAADALQWFRPQILTVNENFALAGRELTKALIARINGTSPTELQSITQPSWRDRYCMSRSNGFI
jgi:LacI family transcriptional regulator